jgi:group I intron endonuclease
MYICRALLAHGYSSFSVSILNYVDITNLSIYETKTKILQCEQFFIDTLLPEFNITSTAGSLLGFKHSEEIIAKMILAKKDANKGKENPMYGKNIHLK